LFLHAIISYGQRNINGTVVDIDGLPLIGANVLGIGTTLGTITDIDGNFRLTLDNNVVAIVVSYTGYETQTISIDGRTTISVTLEEGSLLDEVVVTALGVSRSEKALGYAVQEVSSKSIQNANTVSAIDALAGAAAGVQVTSSSGAAGAASRIVLRGQTSFNGNNQALLVVDGIRLNNDENHSERSLGGVANSNRAIDLNPADIESMTILKGAAATALYGIEGARGVILITTKKGSNNELKIDFSSSITANKVSNLVEFQQKYAQGSQGTWSGPETGQSGSWGPEVSSLTYSQDEALYESLYESPTGVFGSEGYIHDKNGFLVANGNGAAANTYGNIEDFFQTGYTNNNNIAISGGGSDANYRFSYGNSLSTGIVPNNEFNRHNLGLNLGGKAFDDKLDVTFGANYVNSSGSRIQQGSNTSGVMLGLLRTPVTFDNANGLADPVNENSSYQFPNNDQRNYRGGGGYDNPYWVVNNSPFNDQVNRFFGNLGVTYSVSDWLQFNTVLGVDAYSDNRVQRFEIGSRNVTGGLVIEDNFNYKHTDMYFNIRGKGSLASNFTMSYNLGINLYDEKLKQNTSTGNDLNFFGFAELGNTSNVASSAVNTNLKTAGVYGTLDFGYRNFLYLTFTGRNDWSSTLINPNAEFDAGAISFFYPSVSLGFIFTELLENDILSFGKVRVSYAEVGGGAPSPYSTSTAFLQPVQNLGTINDLNDGWTNGIGFPFQGVSGYVYNGVAGNPFLSPSKTKDIELGLDLRFFRNRIGLDITAYKRNSDDQIIAINIPNTTGFQRAIVNSGELKTIGGEVVLNISPIAKKGFAWDIGFNFSKWKTTVESLPEGVQNQYLDGFTGTGIFNLAPEVDENGNITETFEFGQIRGGAFQRVNTDAGSFDPNMAYNPEGALIIDNDPSSVTYGYPMADPSPRVIGNPNPDWMLGIVNSFRYKNLSVSFLFDIKEGGDIWNGTKGALTFFGRTDITEDRGSVIVFDGVKAGDAGVNDIAVELSQEWFQGNGGGFGDVDEHFVEDGSFQRLRYLTLSYELGDVLGSAGFDKLSISVTGRNLLLFTNYTGYDPELSLVGGSSNGQGLDYFQMPNTKSYSIGLNATF
jgi:TonB-linked SusC/RagA family outer membrane protein